MKSNLTLLYVEDDEVVRENYTTIFKCYFKNVLVAENGNDALQIYQDNKVDIGIFDISIPGINGLNLASKIRESDKDIELVIISAYSDKEKLLKAVKLKLFTYLIKPVNHNEFIDMLEEIVDQKSNHTNIILEYNYQWNPQAKALFYNDIPIKISHNEMQIVEILIKNKNNYLNACQIQEYLDDTTIPISDSCNNIVKIISRFKKKLNMKFTDDDFFIENCYGLGYKISL